MINVKIDSVFYTVLRQNVSSLSISKEKVKIVCKKSEYFYPLSDFLSKKKSTMEQIFLLKDLCKQ